MSFDRRNKTTNNNVSNKRGSQDIALANSLLRIMKDTYKDAKPDKTTALLWLRMEYYGVSDGLHVAKPNSAHTRLNELIAMGLPCYPIDQSIYHAIIQLHAFHQDFQGFLATLYKMKAQIENPKWYDFVPPSNAEGGRSWQTDDANGSILTIDEHTFEPAIKPILLDTLAAKGELQNCFLFLDEM
ncbi:hypothetical protein RFI_33706, partial [Reticulomyxa filosa]